MCFLSTTKFTGNKIKVFMTYCDRWEGNICSYKVTNIAVFNNFSNCQWMCQTQQLECNIEVNICAKQNKKQFY